MTLEEAIEILGLENKHPWNRDNSNLREAVKLGIEASERERKYRENNPDAAPFRLLPSETAE